MRYLASGILVATISPRSSTKVTGGALKDICDFVCYLKLFQYKHTLNYCKEYIIYLVLSNISDISVKKAVPLFRSDAYHPALVISFYFPLARGLQLLLLQSFMLSNKNYLLSLIDWHFLVVDVLDFRVQLFYNFVVILFL